MRTVNAPTDFAAWLATKISIAAHTAIIRFDPEDGVVLQLDAEVCDRHNAIIAASASYVRSIELRLRPEPAAPSPAAGS